MPRLINLGQSKPLALWVLSVCFSSLSLSTAYGLETQSPTANQVSNATELTVLTPHDFPAETAWLKLFRTKLETRFDLFQYKLLHCKTDSECVITFAIDSKGEIENIMITRNSGDESLDLLSQALVQSLSDKTNKTESIVDYQKPLVLQARFKFKAYRDYRLAAPLSQNK